MAFDNTSPLFYAAGGIVDYVNAQRGVSDDVGGPKLHVVGIYDKKTGDIADVNHFSNTANVYSVATSNAALSQLVTANSSIRGAVIVNESANDMYLAYSNTAAANAYTYLVPSKSTWEMPSTRIWTGPISCILGGGSGQARCTVLF